MGGEGGGGGGEGNQAYKREIFRAQMLLQVTWAAGREEKTLIFFG